MTAALFAFPPLKRPPIFVRSLYVDRYENGVLVVAEIVGGPNDGRLLTRNEFLAFVSGRLNVSQSF